MIRLYLSKIIASLLNKCMNPQLMFLKFYIWELFNFQFFQLFYYLITDYFNHYYAIIIITILLLLLLLNRRRFDKPDNIEGRSKPTHCPHSCHCSVPLLSFSSLLFNLLFISLSFILLLFIFLLVFLLLVFPINI